MNNWKSAANKVDIVIDIETVVNPVSGQELEDYMKDYAPPGNYSKPESILRHREKFMLEAADKLADDKKFSIGGKRMISCALGRIERQEVVDIQSWASDDLSVITGGIVEYLNDFGDYRLVGFNHKGFDIPEVLKSMALTKTFPKSRPAKWDIIDLCEHPFKRMKLKDIAKAFGIETCGLNGASVAQLYADGDWDTIRKYNEDDVRITGMLFVYASALLTF